MSKKVAIIVPNPVNGFGLFAYLEACFENGVEAKTFAVSTSPVVKTNSGYELKTNGTISELKGHEADYDGVVFACGDAMIHFSANIGKQENQDMLEVLRNFDKLNKKIAGHCAAGLIFEIAGISTGKKMAVHPLTKTAIKNGIAVDNQSMIDQNLFTAKNEDYVLDIIPWFIRFL